jgi:hypothetical protein
VVYVEIVSLVQLSRLGSNNTPGISIPYAQKTIEKAASMMYNNRTPDILLTLFSLEC